jgi:hypothetical protein
MNVAISTKETFGILWMKLTNAAELSRPMCSRQRQDKQWIPMLTSMLVINDQHPNTDPAPLMCATQGVLIIMSSTSHKGVVVSQQGSVVNVWWTVMEEGTCLVTYMLQIRKSGLPLSILRSVVFLHPLSHLKLQCSRGCVFIVSHTLFMAVLEQWLLPCWAAFQVMSI